MTWALTPLTEEQREIQTRRARVRRSARSRRISAQWDRDAYFEPSLVGKLGELGFLGMLIPEEYDGLGLDTLTYLVALEEIAIVDASVAVMLSVHNSLPTQMILRWGTDEQKERFLKPMARGEMLGAFALSEPEAGSDAASLTHAGGARRRRLDPQRHQGVGVERHQGRRHPRHGAHRFARRPPRRARHRRVHHHARPARLQRRQEGRQDGAARVADGAAPLLRHARAGRPPARRRRAVGSSTRCSRSTTGGSASRRRRSASPKRRCAHAAAYAAERKQFGKPIKEFQAIQFKLADMATRVAAARALLHAAATAKDRGEHITQFSAMAKLLASETAMWVTTQAIQIFGGYGYVKDYPVERLFRDAKVTEIYEGTSEIQRIVIARELYSHR